MVVRADAAPIRQRGYFFQTFPTMTLSGPKILMIPLEGACCAGRTRGG